MPTPAVSSLSARVIVVALVQTYIPLNAPLDSFLTKIRALADCMLAESIRLNEPVVDSVAPTPLPTPLG